MGGRPSSLQRTGRGGKGEAVVGRWILCWIVAENGLLVVGDGFARLHTWVIFERPSKTTVCNSNSEIVQSFNQGARCFVRSWLWRGWRQRTSDRSKASPLNQRQRERDQRISQLNFIVPRFKRSSANLAGNTSCAVFLCGLDLDMEGLFRPHTRMPRSSSSSS